MRNKQNRKRQIPSYLFGDISPSRCAILAYQFV